MHFVGKKAIETGGVCWNMFGEFWQVAFENFFDGSILLAPAVHAQSDMSAFCILGTISSHGYLLCNVLPT